MTEILLNYEIIGDMSHDILDDGYNIFDDIKLLISILTNLFKQC